MRWLWLFLPLLFAGCGETTAPPEYDQPYVLVLGVAQDAGYPQIGCDKDCCKPAWSEPERRKYAVSLAVIDPVSDEWWLIECTPDIKDQLRLVKYHLAKAETPLPDGIFLTHGHMGHYGGLMHFGREAMGSSGIPVYGMPRMREYLANNGPWSQLIKLHNIEYYGLEADQTTQLNERISLTPFLVPHRDEYTETVGFRIDGPNQSMLFIPDIDKWDQWGENIVAKVEEVDLALLDATFYANGEIPGRDMSEIPHPFISETMELFANSEGKSKIRFVHFNHTNPVMQPDSPERKKVTEAGFGAASQLDTYGL